MRRITSFGYIWIDSNGKQYASQVGHYWNGETLSKSEQRILRRLLSK